MKKVPQLPVCTRDRQIISIERVYTPSTFYMKSPVAMSIIKTKEFYGILKTIVEILYFNFFMYSF